MIVPVLEALEATTKPSGTTTPIPLSSTVTADDAGTVFSSVPDAPAVIVATWALMATEGHTPMNSHWSAKTVCEVAVAKLIAA